MQSAVISRCRMEPASQVVGIAEDGKYNSLTEDPQPAMFLPILQSPSTSTWIVVRSNRDPQQLGAAIRSTLRQLDSGLPVYVQRREHEMDPILFGPRMATLALGVLGVMGAMLAITGIFGMAAYSVSKRLKELGIRVALGAQRKEVLRAALGTHIQIAGHWFRRRLASGNSGEPCTGIHRLSGNSPRSADISWCRCIACRCWGYWPHGFQPDARSRLILWYCCARNELAEAPHKLCS